MKRILTVLLALALVLYGCGSSKPQISDIASVNYSGSKIGIPDANAFDAKVMALLPEAKLMYYTNSIDAVMALTSGKIDGFAYDRVNLDYMAAVNEKVAVLPDSFAELAICAATAKGNDKLMGQFNEFIASYRADGTADEMYKRWILEKGGVMPPIAEPEGAAGKLKVITNGVTEPMNFYQGTELAGYDIEFARRFALTYDYEIEFVVMDYAAMPSAIHSDKADCIISDFFYNEERAQEVDYSDPYITTEVTLLVEKSRLGTNW